MTSNSWIWENDLNFRQSNFRQIFHIWTSELCFKKRFFHQGSMKDAGDLESHLPDLVSQLFYGYFRTQTSFNLICRVFIALRIELNLNFL